MTSLITGATGFVGQKLLQALVTRGQNVIAVSRQPHLCQNEKLVTWRPFPKSRTDWYEILEEVSTVYHFAWSSLPQTSNEDPLGDASDNILGTLRLLEAARTRKNLRIVFPSSGGTIYGVLTSIPADETHGTRPRCAYGVSKLTIENYLTMYHDIWGLDCIALRISNAYGPGQRVERNFGAIATFAARAMRGEPITIFGDGSIIRDYLYIDDLIEAIIAAGNLRGGMIVVNIGSGVGKSLNDIIDVLSKLCARKIQVDYVAAREFDVTASVLDVSLAETALNWKAHTPFEVGVHSTLKALRSVYHASPGGSR